MGRLAQRLADAGLQRIDGRVMGSTTYFRQDWDAPGWNDAARDFVNRPTALTFDGNQAADPERGPPRRSRRASRSWASAWTAGRGRDAPRGT